jgi:hypothetical protein
MACLTETREFNQSACQPERHADESGESDVAVLNVRSGSMNNQYHSDSLWLKKQPQPQHRMQRESGGDITVAWELVFFVLPLKPLCPVAERLFCFGSSD